MPKKDAGKENAELVVLSLLEGGPMYGYAISKEVARRSGEQMRLTPGVLYPILRELEVAGLIKAEWEEIRSDRREAEEGAEDDAAAGAGGGGGGGRRRKWYKLSAKGKKRLAQRVEAHQLWRAIIDRFIGKPEARGGEAGEP